MHPRLTELLNYLEAQRDRVLGAASRLPRDRWSVRPSPEKWSIAEVYWHLQRVERSIAKLIAKRAEEARANGHPAESSTSSVIGLLDGRGVEDRSHRIVAPSQITPPEPVDPVEVERQLDESRSMLRE